MGTGSSDTRHLRSTHPTVGKGQLHMDKDIDTQDQPTLAQQARSTISRRDALATGAKVGLSGAALAAGISPISGRTPAVHAASKVTLRYMHWETELTIQSTWYRDVLAGFTKLHPNVVVENDYVANAQYLTTLTSMAASKALPDIFHAHVLAAQLGRAGLIVDYHHYLPASFIERFNASTIKQFTFDNNKLYALPLTAQTFGVFVNNAIMSKLHLTPPTTWDDLIAMVPKIRGAGYTPLALGNQLRNTGPDFFLPLVTQTGGNVYALDALTQTGMTWNSKPVIEAFTLLQRLSKANVFPLGVNGISQTQAEQMFYRGQAAMLFDGSWEPPVIAQQAPAALAKNYSVVKVPAFSATAQHWCGDGSGAGVAVNNHGPNRAMALEFVRYLFSPSVYNTFIKNTQVFPSMASAQNMITDPKVRQMIGYLPDGADHILFGNGSWNAVSDAVQSVLSGSLAPQAAAASMQTAVLKARQGRH